jgi:hypothetical protein
VKTIFNPLLEAAVSKRLQEIQGSRHCRLICLASLFIEHAEAQLASKPDIVAPVIELPIPATDSSTTRMSEVKSAQSQTTTTPPNIIITTAEEPEPEPEFEDAANDSHAPQAATQKAIVSPVPEETPVIPNTQPPPSVDPEVKAQPLTVTDTRPHKTNKVMWTFLALVRIQCLGFEY